MNPASGRDLKVSLKGYILTNVILRKLTIDFAVTTAIDPRCLKQSGDAVEEAAPAVA